MARSEGKYFLLYVKEETVRSEDYLKSLGMMFGSLTAFHSPDSLRSDFPGAIGDFSIEVKSTT
jgi:hypothetical protein